MTNLSAAIVDNIKVKGNDRISEETVILFGEISKGTNYDNNGLNKILKNLYNTNYFEDVNLKIESNTLIITIKEYPIIQNIIYNGVKAKKFLEIISKITSLKEKSSFNNFVLKQDVSLIKNAFKQSGYYFVEVDSSLIKNDNNTVDLTFDIDLGDKAKINKIKFIGDKVFKDRKLRNIIVSEESKPWKILSGKKYLDQQRIALDVRLLKSFFLNNGYYDVDVKNSTSTYLDDNNFELSFVINSGNKYFFRDVFLELPTDFDLNHFTKINKVLNELKGKRYSLIAIEEIIDSIEKISLSKQYEFIDATFNESSVGINNIDLTISLKESKKAYVEKINIFGNNITRENVIRNGLLLDEGDGFNKLLLDKTINKLRSKNIFASISKSVTEGSSEEFKVIDITVQEKPTGEISAGAGIGTSGGQVSFSVKENNYLGKGMKVGASIDISQESVAGSLTIINPNFNYSERSLSTSISRTSTDRIVTYGYKNTETGASIGTSYEQYEDLYFSPSISAFFEELETTNTASAALQKQKGNYFDLDFNYGVTLDKRNLSYRPTEGFISKFNQSLPLISKTYSLNNSYEFKTYKEIGEESVSSFVFFVGSVNSINNKDVRISERLFIPSNRLRGFEKGKVGPIDNGDFVGGNYVAASSFNLTLPKLFDQFQNTDLTFFIDTANLWGVDYNDSIDDNSKIRSSTGLTLDIFTPVGPLNFSLSQPITQASTDKTETFRFNLGTTF